jgi:hypothetical protein
MMGLGIEHHAAYLEYYVLFMLDLARLPYKCELINDLGLVSSGCGCLGLPLISK